MMAEAAQVVISIGSPMCGGIGVGFFGCLLSWSNRQKTEQGGKHTQGSRCCQVTGTIGAFVFSLFSLFPLVYGAPINTVNVVRAGSLLPANALFSQVFGLRPLVRDDVVGTLVAINGVICFILFAGSEGPELSHEEFKGQVSRPLPTISGAILLALFAASAGWMLLVRRPRQGAVRVTALAVSTVNSCSIAAMDIATKAWASALHANADVAFRLPFFWAALLVQAFFFVVGKWSMVYGCSRCDVLLFVPINMVLNIFFTVAAGMVIMGEAARIKGWKEWLGLASAWFCVMGGIIMLVSGPADGARPPLEDPREHSDRARSASRHAAAAYCQDPGSSSEEPASGSGSSGQDVNGRISFQETPLLISQSSQVARLNTSQMAAAESRALWNMHMRRKGKELVQGMRHKTSGFRKRVSNSMSMRSQRSGASEADGIPEEDRDDSDISSSDSEPVAALGARELGRY